MYSLVQAVLQFHYYKTGIPESKHLGGFPITGQFLTCTNPQVIEAHDAKVYGKEPPGTPPMTVLTLMHVTSKVNVLYYLDHLRTLDLNSLKWLKLRFI